uniref:CRIB domain-containing protein n=1 Tax=Serinus canaria TaxID=9135 RepID=A0A8C9NID7_SERCA
MPILKQLVSNSAHSKRRSRADLTAEMISAPLGDFRHTMHVGVPVLPPALPCCPHPGRAPGRSAGTCRGRAFSARVLRKQESSCWPDLAQGWDPRARQLLPRAGSANAALSSPSPALSSRGGGDGAGGQDWLSLLPRAGGQGVPWGFPALWGCPGPG